MKVIKAALVQRNLEISLRREYNPQIAKRDKVSRGPQTFYLEKRPLNGLFKLNWKVYLAKCNDSRSHWHAHIGMLPTMTN